MTSSALRRFGRRLGTLLPGFVVSACTIGMPFRGPGIEALGPEPPSEVTLVVTHAVLDPERRDRFDDYIFEVADTLSEPETPVDGFVGFSIRKEIFGDEVWTMTVWRDEAAMMAWSRTETHRRAIAETADAIVTMDSRRVRVAASRLPLSWDEAVAYLDDGGRTPAAATP